MASARGKVIRSLASATIVAVGQVWAQEDHIVVGPGVDSAIVEEILQSLRSKIVISRDGKLAQGHFEAVFSEDIKAIELDGHTYRVSIDRQSPYCWRELEILRRCDMKIPRCFWYLKEVREWCV